MCGNCRFFKPFQHSLPNDEVLLEDVVRNDNSGQYPLRRLYYGPAYGIDYKTLVVTVDGACLMNGQNPTDATFGVYFNEGHPLNEYAHTPTDLRVTNNAGELFAIQRALQSVIRNIDHLTQASGSPIERLIIGSDSEYAVKGCSVWFNTWHEQKFRKRNGDRVKNAELIYDIHTLATDLHSKLNIHVFFWLIGREQNRQADRLANFALQENRIARWTKNYCLCEEHCAYWDFQT